MYFTSLNKSTHTTLPVVMGVQDQCIIEHGSIRCYGSMDQLAWNVIAVLVQWITNHKSLYRADRRLQRGLFELFSLHLHHLIMLTMSTNIVHGTICNSEYPGGPSVII